MPKDTSHPPADDGEVAVKPPRGSGKKTNTLKRNMACESCRKRRLRCDAARPNCTTCIRSYNHIMTHLKAGQPAPDYPVCNYEDHSDSNGHAHSSATAAAAPRRPPSTSTSTSASSASNVPPAEPKEKVNELESRVQQLESMLKMAVGAQGGPPRFPAGGEPARGGPPPPHGATGSAFAFGGGTPSPGLNSLPGFNFGPAFDHLRAGEGRVLPPPTWQGQQSSAPFAQSPLHFPQTYQPAPAQPPTPAPLSPFPSGQTYAPPPFPNRATNNASVYTPFPHPFQAHLTHPPPASAPTAPSPPPNPQQPAWAFPPSYTGGIPQPYSTFPTSSSQTSETIPTPSPHTSSHGGAAHISPMDSDRASEEGAKKTSNSSAPTFEDLLDNVPDVNLGDLESDDFLLQLLWPSWPAHLPSPGRFDHILESFFSNVPFATHLINKPRFLARIHLPPKHKDFPHPALLHAICAVTARYIGGVILLPTAPYTLQAKPRYPSDERNQLPFEHARPVWDGYGTPPTAGLTPGRDEDFGQIHFTWSRMYIDKVLDRPDHWFEVTLALCLLAQFAHAHGRWLDGFSIIAVMTRLVIPLKLNTRQYTDRRAITKMSMVTEPKDEIEKIERQNLFWVIFCIDTWSSTSSGWQGTLPSNDIWCSLPIGSATFPPAVTREPTQFADSRDLFFHQPKEHASPFAIAMKGTLLLRRVVDFVRRADMGNVELPRADSAFKDLDETIAQFHESYPAELKRPYVPSPEGFAADREALMARAYPHACVISLHERYWDASDPLDESIPKLRTATRGMLDIVHATLHSTSDYGLFHPFMTYTFHLAARTLLRLLQAALEQGQYSEVPTLMADVDVLRAAMRRVGDRLPIGHLQEGMIASLLSEIITTTAAGGPDGGLGAPGDGGVVATIYNGVVVPIRLKRGEGNKEMWRKNC